VVQLRQENLLADAYNLVGFQNHLKFGEQKRVLRLIPGLQNAEFVKMGQVHRNTFICSPKVLSDTLQMKQRPQVLFAGQISGVEGYIEAMATGYMAGVHAAAIVRGDKPIPAPRETALGSLSYYVANADAKNFQPANITFAMLPPLEGDERKKLKQKRERHKRQVEIGLEAFGRWLDTYALREVISGDRAQAT
jgi:methylenetetrahydrofolate--tRNA-(uracil-5-)-methyltransferase